MALVAEDWAFRLLGPLEVRHGGVLVPVTAGKQRVLIAVLALSAGEPVSVDRLVACVWGERPPASVRNTLLNYVLRLRRTLCTDPGPGPLVTSSAGYRLDVEPDTVDVHRFGSLLRRARSQAAAGQAGSASGLLDEALGCWRGQPLMDVPSELLHREVVPTLVEQRLAAQEDRIDLDLRLGRHRDLVTELVTLTTAHPLRERMWAALMLALYRSGRTGEALAAFRQAGTVLAEELGLDTGPELRRLHQAILTGDPDLAVTDPAPQGAGPEPAASPVMPRQLPASTGYFVGRSSELQRLSTRLPAASSTPLMVITAIGGTAGIGKTALAVHWAHRHAGQFPDGQLYVNLRGFDPTGTPLPASAALRGFLDGLGVASAQVPADLEAQAGLYRSLLADKRMLVVLDNARDADQVRPLLPGSAGCLVLVTSRDQLAGLAALDGAHSLTLDLLTAYEARELLTHRLGAERITAEPDAVDELITLCARLPLALNITAARAAARPTFPLAAFATELRETRDRLNALETGDAASLRAVFSWSYHTLSDPAARMFRLLGIHPGPDITAPAAASLAATTRNQARTALNELARAHLLTEHTPGRYTFHDLLRTYATEQTHTHDTSGQRNQALRRTLDHYVHTTNPTTRLANPNSEPIVLPVAEPGVTPEALTDLQQAWNWFTAEHQVLLAAIDQAAARGLDTRVYRLAWNMAIFLKRRGHWHDYRATQANALAAAQRLGDLAGQASAHRNLGYAHILTEDYPQAQTHLGLAIELSRQLGNPRSQAEAHYTTAVLLDRQNRYREALEHARQALPLYREAGDRHGEICILNAFGWFHSRTGDHHQALIYCREALELQRGFGQDSLEGSIWDTLGHAHHHLGQHRQAIESYRHALDLYRKAGIRYDYASTLTHLGDTHHATGDHDAARDTWEQAQTILENLQHSDAEHVRQKLKALT